jgi:predicted nucleic acid-binding protein
MTATKEWFIARIGFVETFRALTVVRAPEGIDAFLKDWPAFNVVELNPTVAQLASELTARHDLRSLDAIHLASALMFHNEDLTLATWDRRLHNAALREKLNVLPAEIPHLRLVKKPSDD